MSLLFRKQPAEVKRSAMASGLLASQPYFVSQTFASVNAAEGDTALQSIALRTTADLIASLASELPAYVEVDGKRRKGALPPNIEDPGGDGRGREDWAYRWLMSHLLRGNAYGFETSWDLRTGRAKTAELMHPDYVYPVANGDGGIDWYAYGSKIDKDMLPMFRHWRTNPVAGRELGLSPVQAHATQIGVSLAASQFGKQWFDDGAHPSGMLVNEKPLGSVDAATAKTRLKDSMVGTRDPLILGEGWKYQDIQVNAEESQFLATMRYSEAQCARIFGPGFAEILGYETGSSMTYGNVVDRRQDLLVFSMNKWIRRLERALTELLPPSTQSIKLNRDALLEATTLQRYQAHKIAIDGGWELPSEVREIEGKDPIDGIDDRKPNSAQGGSNGNAAQS